jgi:hypothetical protein
MLNVNLFDNNFYHSKDHVGVFTSTYTYPPTKIYYIDRLMSYDGITLFTDDFIFDPVVDQVFSRLKIAWLFEPRCFSNYYDRIIEIEDKFDYILTYDAKLLKRGKKYIKYIVGQSRIPDEFAKIYPKTKGISMIASNKRMSDGHNFRHEIIEKLQPKYQFDVWGSGYKPFDDKLEPLKDYKYSICVMNSSADNFFTEVLLDCFRVGTIPIFWGCPNIGEYFLRAGFPQFETINELDTILQMICGSLSYGTMQTSEAIAQNFEYAKAYIHTDDHIATILEKL